MNKVGIASAAAVAAALAATLWLLRTRRQLAAGRRIIARYGTRVVGRPWYREVIVTEEAVPERDGSVLRSMHLGSDDNVPESMMVMRPSPIDGDALRPVASALLKPHLQYSLLAFVWLGDGFPAADEDGARAALVGVAGGSLLHFWRECVPGGAQLPVDAVELDEAVLTAARDHCGLRHIEPPSGHVHVQAADGAQFLREAEDEAYCLLVVDLDVGNLMPNPTKASEAAGGGADGGAGAGGGSGAGSRAVAARKAALAQPDPIRDMYRVLDSKGVLVINEYREEPDPAERMRVTLATVRALRRYFPRVYVLRTNTQHNTMYLAPADGRCAAACDSLEALVEAARATAARLGLGGIDLGALVEQLPANRYQCYS